GLVPGARGGGGHGFRGRVAERQLAAVREADFRRAGARVSVARTERVDDDLGAGRQRVAVPAATEQRARGAALDTPALNLAVHVGVDVDPRVRVDPLELHDLALEADRLVTIELGGERMVRDGSAGGSDRQDGADRGRGPFLDLHGDTPRSSNLRV